MINSTLNTNSTMTKEKAMLKRKSKVLAKMLLYQNTGNINLAALSKEKREINKLLLEHNSLKTTLQIMAEGFAYYGNEIIRLTIEKNELKKIIENNNLLNK